MVRLLPCMSHLEDSPLPSSKESFSNSYNWIFFCRNDGSFNMASDTPSKPRHAMISSISCRRITTRLVIPLGTRGLIPNFANGPSRVVLSIPRLKPLERSQSTFYILLSHYHIQLLTCLDLFTLTLKQSHQDSRGQLLLSA